MTGIGTAANAIETQISMLEAKTSTGGIYLENFGTVEISDLTIHVDGLHVINSGDIALTAWGSIRLGQVGTSNFTPAVRIGNTGGDATLTAIGYNSDIITTGDADRILIGNGDLILRADRDVAFDAVSRGQVQARDITIDAGRDFSVTGTASLFAGLDLELHAGRNVTSIGRGTAAGQTAFVTTGPGGTLVAGPDGLIGQVRLTILADRLLLPGSATTNLVSSFGPLSIAPATPGRPINIGSTTDSFTALEISDDDLDRMIAPSVTIGDASSGRVTFTGSIDPRWLNQTPRPLTVQSGTNIDQRGSINLASDLTLRAGNNVTMSAGATIDAHSLSVFVDTPNADPGVGGLAALSGAIVTTATTISGNGDNDTLNAAIFGSTLLGMGGIDPLNGSGEDDQLDGGAAATRWRAAAATIRSSSIGRSTSSTRRQARVSTMSPS